MDINFWEQRWSLNQTAFHLPSVNPHLKKHLSAFNLEISDKVFIPLCGKSNDIAWLASEEYRVLGVECSDIAIKSFFSENKLLPDTAQDENFSVYNSRNICLLGGDYFALTQSQLADTVLVYDRASLIALPESLRKPYVNHLIKLLPESAEIFLITLEYNQADMSGPPFSVDHNQVQQLYAPHFKVEILDEIDVLEQHQKFKERGLNYLIERIYRITK